MLCRTYCGTLIGIEAITVTVEIDVSVGVNFFMVGLPDSAVRESQQRITTSLAVIGAKIPGKKIVVNLAPADLKKEGSSFDLAIAIGILAASGQYSFPNLGDYFMSGELALDGSLRGVPGALPLAVHASNEYFKCCIFPAESAEEAAGAGTGNIYAANSLKDVIAILLGERAMKPLGNVEMLQVRSLTERGVPDFSEIRGQEHVKRGLEIAAAGAHNLIMCGVPGSGKSMMAKALAGILPPMSREESIETGMIYSVAGRWGREISNGLSGERPFRAPHHSASNVAITGGGSRAIPGEISLSHNGVLYLDELPEFRTDLLESLRQPLEDKVINIARSKYKISYPCNFMLIASMNPCPCGYYGYPGDKCTCQQYRVLRYRSKISGPLIDRIDIHLEVNPVEISSLLNTNKAESSDTILKRVEKAREGQYNRFNQRLTNSNMTLSHIKEYCKLGEQEQKLIEFAVKRLDLSARAYHRILKVSRTIADLDCSAKIEAAHLAEAIQYRGS